MERMVILVDRPGIIFLESATPIRAVDMLPIRRRTLVQEHDEAWQRHLGAERIAREARWSDPTYLMGDPGLTWGG